MLACAAGKDVYVEKPLTLFVREGRWMIDVAAPTRGALCWWAPNNGPGLTIVEHAN